MKKYTRTKEKTMNPQFEAGAIAFIKSKFRAAPCGLSMQERKEWYKGYDNCNPAVARKIMAGV